jgi:hypothetical protein
MAVIPSIANGWMLASQTFHRCAWFTSLVASSGPLVHAPTSFFKRLKLRKSLTQLSYAIESDWLVERTELNQ